MSVIHRKSLWVVPQAAYRIRGRGQTKNPRALRYLAYRDELRHLAGGWTLPGDRLLILFEIPMPRSWPRQKRVEMFGEAHRQVPDTENLLKAVVDALYPGDDCKLSDEHGAKVWSDIGAIHVFEDCRAPSPSQLLNDLRGVN
jgi:Holliday junction resolvase RusA-like endonuclease